MLSLWALFLLSAMVISWALDIDSRFTLSGTANRAFQAEALACSGAEIALHPSVQPGSTVLKGRPAPNQSYEVNISGEGGRLNVNWIVTGGEGSERLEVLRKYLEIKGVDLNERDHMIDSLLDWVELNTGLHHLNGAGESENYHPSHALLNRIDELKKVAGWQDFTSTPGWDNELAANNIIKSVDLAWASRDVLLALPGMSEGRVDQFLALRRGPDGIDGTADDPFKNEGEALEALGFAQKPQELDGLVGFKEPVMRVVSVGKSGDVTRVVQMVIQKRGDGTHLITWKEF